MKSKRLALRTASFLAAAALTAALPLSLPENKYASVTMTAYADESLGDLYYTVYEDHVEITGSNYQATSIEIPSTIGGLPVTVIGDYAFNGSSITSIKIPDTVKVIGNYAFTMCSGLKSVTLPDSVESIGIRAFELCSSLSEVNFPSHKIEMSSKVFDSTPWLTAQRRKDPYVVVNGTLIDAYDVKGDVVIPSDIKEIAAGAFEWNENITSVVLPSNITKVNDSTFFNCSNLKSVDMKYVTEIDGMAFGGCEKLSELKLSGKMVRIDFFAFSDITSRASITVYGSKAEWDKVDKPDEDEFLNNASYTFDESFVYPQDEVLGDVNKDGEFNTADLVMLSKWIVRNPEAEIKDWKAGDFNKDEVLDVYDLVLMRKALISK